MGAKLGAGGSPQADINMTPLIDIVLVVLIIMMVNIPISIERMGLKLPSPKPPDTEQPPNPDQLAIALYEDGTVALNRRLMKEDKLTYELGRRLLSTSHKNVFVDAHPKVKYGLVVHMVDLARSAGANQVGLAKMKPEGPLPFNQVDAGTMPRGLYPNSPRVAGGMGEKAAMDALHRVLPALRSCYDQALAAPGAVREGDILAGTLTIEAVVGPRGEQMEPAHILPGEGTLEDPTNTLIPCLELALPTMTFAPLGPDKTARALMPVLFSPG
ncbi:MAG: biopolymer transporter ExbD [Deltaproteobacteria bacterium]|nr:biopolymer transporter ExbD [Deltaproteobacteria bacterium]